MKDDPFFNNLPPELSTGLNDLYEEMTELKVHRDSLIDQYKMYAKEDELLEMIKSGEVPEHPAYDHYLAVLAINAEIEKIREECRKIMEGC